MLLLRWDEWIYWYFFKLHFIFCFFSGSQVPSANDGVQSKAYKFCRLLIYKKKWTWENEKNSKEFCCLHSGGGYRSTFVLSCRPLLRSSNCISFFYFFPPCPVDTCLNGKKSMCCLCCCYCWYCWRCSDTNDSVVGDCSNFKITKLNLVGTLAIRGKKRPEYLTTESLELHWGNRDHQLFSLLLPVPHYFVSNIHMWCPGYICW